MIKVLNIITDSNIGGAGNVLLNYMKKASHTEFEHTVIIPENSLLAPRLRVHDIRIIEMAGIGEKSFSVSAIGRFKHEIKQAAPNIVHTHASLSARIAARQWGKCAIIHTRHCAYPQGKIKTSFPVKQALGLMNNRLSDIIIAISPATRDNLIETGTAPQKIVTMFNGVDSLRRLSEEEKGKIKESLGISGGEFVCAIVARLVPEKGHKYILEAADILRDLPIRFIIAGNGPAEAELRDEAVLRKLDNCIFTGFLDDVTMIDNITDLQLNASYGTETSSLSLLEGMSLSTPAVVSDFGGNPYLVTDGLNGRVVPKCNSAAMADAIKHMFEEPETLAKMGKSALEVYRTRFTTEIMVANIEQVYRDAVQVK